MSTNQHPPVPFADQLCALANITHIRDYSPTVARKAFQDQEKHFRLLGSIALLLVTEENSDVAPVMFEQTAHEVIFYYSKNRPMAPQEHKYLDGLRRLALTITRVNDCAMALLARVIHMCRPKIVSRIRRLKKCIVPGLSVLEDATGAFRDHLVEKMPDMFPEPENLSCKTFVRRYSSRVSTISNATCSENTLEKLIRFAFFIGSYEDLKSIIHDETVIRRIRKLGGYYSATKWIAGTVKRLEPQPALHYWKRDIPLGKPSTSLPGQLIANSPYRCAHKCNSLPTFLPTTSPLSTVTARPASLALSPRSLLKRRIQPR